MRVVTCVCTGGWHKDVVIAIEESHLYGYFVIEAGVALLWLLIFSKNEFVPTYNSKCSHSDHTFYLKGQFSASVV